MTFEADSYWHFPLRLMLHGSCACSALCAHLHMQHMSTERVQSAAAVKLPSTVRMTITKDSHPTSHYGLCYSNGFHFTRVAVHTLLWEQTATDEQCFILKE